jgi:cob(I)alamin adenosyltransferase
MLYTGKGDDGKTKTFGCDQKISKSSAITEALGCLDEVNSFLGIVKVNAKELRIKNYELSGEQIVENIQQNLFIIQAELAGSDKKIAEDKVRECEKLIGDIEKELPSIKTFFVSGGSELASLFDFARTLARRAERRVVGVVDDALATFAKKNIEKADDLNDKNKSEESYVVGTRQNLDGQGHALGEWTLVYLNRLSSLLYALARISNHYAGITETSPTYS